MGQTVMLSNMVANSGYLNLIKMQFKIQFFSNTSHISNAQ